MSPDLADASFALSRGRCAEARSVPPLGAYVPAWAHCPCSHRRLAPALFLRSHPDRRVASEAPGGDTIRARTMA